MTKIYQRNYQLYLYKDIRELLIFGLNYVCTRQEDEDDTFIQGKVEYSMSYTRKCLHNL